MRSLLEKRRFLTPIFFPQDFVYLIFVDKIKYPFSQVGDPDKEAYLLRNKTCLM